MRILGVFTTVKHSICLTNPKPFKYFSHADHFIKKKKILVCFSKIGMFSWSVCSADRLQYQMGLSSRVNQPVCAEDGTSRCPELPPGNATVPAASLPSQGNPACWNRAQSRQGSRLHTAFHCFHVLVGLGSPGSETMPLTSEAVYHSSGTYDLLSHW